MFVAESANSATNSVRIAMYHRQLKNNISPLTG
jgi:hypothetical protein